VGLGANRGKFSRGASNPGLRDSNYQVNEGIVFVSIKRGIMRRYMLLGLTVLSSCSGDTPRSEPQALQSSGASLVLGSLRQRFFIDDVGPSATRGNTPSLRTVLLGTSDVERFDEQGGRLIARLPDHTRRGRLRPALVRLALRASGAFEVTDETSAMRIRVQRPDATEASAEQTEGWVVYRGGVRGGDVLHRVHAEGTEDFIHFATRPAKEEVRYRVDVSAVAGCAWSATCWNSSTCKAIRGCG
jgi:hypothetical protein